MASIRQAVSGIRPSPPWPTAPVVVGVIGRLGRKSLSGKCAVLPLDHQPEAAADTAEMNTRHPAQSLGPARPGQRVIDGRSPPTIVDLRRPASGPPDEHG